MSTTTLALLGVALVFEVVGSLGMVTWMATSDAGRDEHPEWMRRFWAWLAAGAAVGAAAAVIHRDQMWWHLGLCAFAFAFALMLRHTQRTDEADRDGAQ